MHARAHTHITFSDLSEEESGENEEKNEIKTRERKRIFTPSKVTSSRTRRARRARFARFIDPPLMLLFWIDARRCVPPRNSMIFATITRSTNGSRIRLDASRVKRIADSRLMLRRRLRLQRGSFAFDRDAPERDVCSEFLCLSYTSRLDY